MTTEEFSNEFDIGLNTKYQGTIKLDEYEKSILLTLALETLVRLLYTGKYNGDGIESTEENRVYLNELVRTASLESIPNTSEILNNSNYSYVFKLPEEEPVMFITYELAKLTKCPSKYIEVIPTTLDEYHRIIDNPFRGPSANRVLRLGLNNNRVELISKYPIEDYVIRYIMYPTPIVLTDFPEELKINNKFNNKTECILNPAVHRMILNTALNMVISSNKQEL